MGVDKGYTDSSEMVEADFEGMDANAIKSQIVEYVKQIRQLEKDKKDYSSATNDAVKELTARIGAALFELSGREQ